jgi:phosphoglycerate dehydrogenase-like enzyme
VPLTNSSLVYDEPCAQHALAYMLAEARQLPGSIRDQATTHAWNTPPTRAASFLMKGQTVSLVGYGASPSAWPSYWDLSDCAWSDSVGARAATN